MRRRSIRARAWPRHAALALALALGGNAFAQTGVILHPHAGLEALWLSGTPDPAYRARAAFGPLVGVEARIGGRAYVLPGLQYGNVRLRFGFEDGSGREDAVRRSTLRLRALFGAKLVDGEHLNLRLSAGPAYGIVLDHRADADNDAFGEDDLRGGNLSLDAALGMDFWIVSVDLGYRHGFSRAFTDGSGWNRDARYRGLFATAGFVLGLTKDY